MWETLRIEEVIKRLKTSKKTGLTDEEVKRRQEKYGKNILKDKKQERPIVKFIKQFNDFMIIILIIASIVSAIISYTQAESDYIDSIIIIVIVVLNAIIGCIQEEKAEKAIENLRKMTPSKTRVIRKNKINEINAEELVPGDIIILEAGNNVPADCRILESFNLQTEESSLTGETENIVKDEKFICKQNVPIRRQTKYGIYDKYCNRGTW